MCCVRVKCKPNAFYLVRHLTSTSVTYNAGLTLIAEQRLVNLQSENNIGTMAGSCIDLPWCVGSNASVPKVSTHHAKKPDIVVAASRKSHVRSLRVNNRLDLRHD